MRFKLLAILLLLISAPLRAEWHEAQSEHFVIYADDRAEDVKAFIAFSKIQLNPLQKCSDGNTVSERLQRMAYGGDQAVLQMQNMMLRFYKRS